MSALAIADTPRAARARKPIKVADLFCGAGGSSLGARKALEARGLTMELVCVNHWPVAIETHQRNHPDARHYCVSLDSARPIDLVPEGYLDLLMASPECTHHSRARGGKPVSDQSRMSAWHVLRWASDLWIRCILIENVPEFLEWGPLGRNGRPLQSKKGETFRAFVDALKRLGYRVEWRIQNAANFGDATTRKRLYIKARRDGKPIRWEHPTHSPDGTPDLLGPKKPWRPAREIIDWSRKGRSIFNRKKPLAPKTIARIMAGAEKFGWPEPFLVLLRGTAESQVATSARSVDAPIPTLTAGGGHLGVVEMVAEPLVGGNRENNVPRPAAGPLPGMTTSTGGGLYVVEPEARPLTPFVLAQGATGAPRDVAEPLPTIVGAGAISVTEPVLVAVTGGPKPKAPRSVDSPLGTITTRNGVGMAEAFVFPVNQGHERTRGQRSVAEPLPTIVTRESFGVAEPMIVPYYGRGSGETCASADAPLSTITTLARFGVATASADPIVVQTDQQSGQGGGYTRSVDEPVGTVVTKQNMALVRPEVLQIDGTDAEVAEELEVAARQGRLVMIDGVLHLLDIRFRMLEPDELARAMGFSDEETQYEFVGTKAEVTKQIGNANPVNMCAALVGALFDV